MASPALADQALPGVPPNVGADHRIVKPLREPLEKPSPGNTVRVGNWDVRVSGSVTVDIGVGKGKLPRH